MKHNKKRLNLNKTTIARLGSKDQSSIYGGKKKDELDSVLDVCVMAMPKTMRHCKNKVKEKK